MKEILLALLLFALSAAATITIPGCGSYADSTSTDTFIINQSFNITNTSTITDNACIVITADYSTGTNPIINFNDKQIIQTTGNATYLLLIYGEAANSNPIILHFTNSLNASNVEYFAKLRIGKFTAPFHDEYSVLNYTGTQPIIRLHNVSKALYLDCDSARNVSCNISTASPFNFQTCQLQNLGFINSSNLNSSGWTGIGNLVLSANASCTYPLITNPNVRIFQDAAYITTSGYSITPFTAFYSNKLFFSNGNFTSAIVNSQIGSFQISNGSFQTFSLSANSTYSIGLFTTGYLDGVSMENTNGITNATMKNNYCIGNLCNPLYFANFSGFPFYINGPDSLQPALFQQNYSTLKLYWKQGAIYSLIASTKNNEDSTFYLQPNGEFIAELDNGSGPVNTTFTYNCPSSFSYCYVQLANGTYSITEAGTLASLLADAPYSIYWNNGTANFTPATNYLPPDVNISFSVLSSSGIMEYYGFNITKEYNLTKTTVCFQNITTDNGSTLNCSTNGKGIYKVYTWFKLKNYYVYRPTTKTLFIGNATGLALVSQKLQGENVISGFAYTILLLILAAAGAGFASNYLDTGAGLVGWAIFTIGALLWPGAIVFGEVSVIMVATVSGIIGLAWYGIKQYV